jgi:nucleoside-diphosphate-sugar epimerase
MSRRSGGDPEAGSHNVTAVQGDLGDYSSLLPAVHNVDAVVHAAGAMHGASAAAMRSLNVDGSGAIARAVRAQGVPLFIHISSAAVYGTRADFLELDEAAHCEPSSPYERSKLAAEQVLADVFAESGTRLVVLRPAGIYGGLRPASQAFLREIRDRRLWLHGPPRVMLHPTYVLDVTRAIELVIDAGSSAFGIYNVAGDLALTYDQWIDVNAQAMGIRPWQIRLNGAFGTALARSTVSALKAVGIALPSGLVDAGSAIRSRMLCTAKIRNELGFEAVPMMRGVQETVAVARCAGAL